MDRSYTEDVSKVEGLSKEREMLEVIVGEKIMIEDAKRWFLRENKIEESSGFIALKEYLSTEEVRSEIAKVEREFIQKDKLNNNKMNLVEYVERKYDLLLAKEVKFREKEKENFKEIFILIKMDMSAEDVRALGPTTKFESKKELIMMCEVLSRLELKEKEEKLTVALMKKDEDEEMKEKKEKKKFLGQCNWCKKKGHKEADCWAKNRGEQKETNIPAWKEIKCYKCGKNGHIAKFCKKK